MIEKLYIKDVAKELDLKDNRSVKRWLKNSGIGILCDIGCKRKYVIKEEFESAKIKEMLNYLTKKYKNVDLKQIFDAGVGLYLQLNSNKEQKLSSQSKAQYNKTEYTPKGDSERFFLKSLQNF